MSVEIKTKHVLWTLLLIAIIFLPAVNYLQASVFASTREVVQFKQVLPTDATEISTQEEATDVEYDPDWQREQSRLMRSFTWLEDELKLKQKNKELQVYQNYLNKVEKCSHGDWNCLEDTRWQLDDFAFSMQKVL